MSFNSCKGCLGKWLIYETMPRYLPTRIAFKYGSEPWQVISPADSYLITPTYSPDHYYTVTFKSYTIRGICNAENDPTTVSFTYNVKGDFELVIVGELIERNPFNYRGIFSGNFWGLYNNGGYYNNPYYGYPIFEVYEGCVVNGIGGYALISNIPPWVDEVIPIGNAPINYLLEIFYENSLVFSETRSIKPDVKILPETCQYYFEDKKLVNIYYNNNLNNFMSLSTIGNTSIVWLLNDWSNLLPPRPEPFYILYKGTSACDLPPKIDTECVPECLKCPSGTCAVSCGDVICCYNGDGVAVLSIPKERYCNG